MCDLSRIFSPIGNAIRSAASDVGTFFSRAVTPPGTGGAQAQAKMNADALNAQLATQNQIAQQNLTFAQQTQAKADATNADAKKQQDLANQIAAAASVPAVDSEQARASADNALQKLVSAGAFGVKRLKPLTGAPPLGFRTATGS